MLANTLLFGFHLLTLFASTTALRIPLTQSYTKRTPGASISRTKLGNGISTNQLSATSNDENQPGDVSLSTVNDILYMGNVSIGGNEYTVQLDTGSSDLWIATTDTIPDSNVTSLTYNISYGIGFAEGHIVTAPVSFANADVQAQAFLLATDADNPISGYGAAGIMGLGFTSLSSIDSAVNKSGGSWGRSFLYNVFQAEPDTPNFITFALQRVDDSEDDITGSFTIGEYADNLNDVANMPNISTFPVESPNRWTLLLDGLYVSGVSQPLTSQVLGAPSAKIVALIDSGTSYTYADVNTVNALYSSIQGGSYDNSSGTWSVPCDAEVDVTLVFGGNPYPLHPLDVVDKSLGDPTQCIGTFVAQSFSVDDGEFDWLVGDNVLRSIYTLYDFGDFQTDGSLGNPYIKMLSTTNATAASADFHGIRGGTANTSITATGVSFNTTNSASSGTDPTGSSPTDDLTNNINKLVNYIPVFLGILGFNTLVILCLAICAFTYIFKRRKGKGKGNASREPYHYQRVRSQYDPQDIPPPSPGIAAMPLSNVQTHSRPGSAMSKKPSGGNIGQHDSPFTPPVEIKYDEVEGDMTNSGIRPVETNAENIPGLAYDSLNDTSPTNELPVPRPRFVSTTTMGSDMYGRPQSLFSVSSKPLLGPGQDHFAANRPASTYDMSMGSPGSPGTRSRLNSVPLSDGRPDSTFSTTPLMQRGPSGAMPTSPLSDRSFRPASGFIPSPGPGPGPGPSSGLGGAGGEGEEMMPPPRPRFMSDANMGPRPDSAFSMGSAGAAPMRPQSKFMDTSGERPYSTAM